MNNLDSPFIEEYGYAGLGNDKHEIKIRRNASCDPNIRDDEKPVFDRNITYKATVTYPNEKSVSHSSSNLFTIQEFIRRELSNLSQSDVEKFFKSIDWDALS